MLAALNPLFAGLSWDPGIRGILVVLVGVVVLFGSTYVIVATNTGARLGMLISLAGLFGWLSILTLFWWISPPGIGPRGQQNAWVPVEVYIHNSNYTDVTADGSQPSAKIGDVNTLPAPADVITGAEVIEANPVLADQFSAPPERVTLSDIVGVKDALSEEDAAAVAETLPSSDELGGWQIMSTSAAGEAQAVADTVLVEEGLFTASGEYVKLNAFDTGGKPDRLDECPDATGGALLPDDVLCRIRFKITDAVQLTHPPHYAVVQVQAVVPQQTVPGEAPPAPILDETQPVISVVLERDLGSVRVKPALWFVISFGLFVVLCVVLHNRDKVLDKNLEAADEARAAVKAGS
ncbi:MAG: hypothetical protein MUF83_13670 [Acidimicrobiales bacterium]|jgi:hypothetical protein|nr:hypothetical protein [Acidimicrobiales bacterium]